MRAAVANGADAVYFGLANFNARHRAENVAGESLSGTLDYLHSHNVRGYVAFNTLVFSDELEKAAGCVLEIAASGRRCCHRPGSGHPAPHRPDGSPAWIATARPR